MSEPTWPPASASVVNPYAPPKASITPAALDGDQEYAEQIRRELIKHETSIKSVGFLYLFGATFMVIFAISLIAISLLGTGEPSVGLGLGIVAFYGVLAALSIYLGIGLRKLSPKIRTGVTILSVIGLLGFPLGTLINAYILYLLHSDKGKRVMSAEYQGIIAQTPHIKYRTPVWLIVLLVLIIVGFFLLIYLMANP
jgi:hypothetical protein